MAVLPIVTIPNEVLTKKCQRVEKVDDEVKALAKNLVDTLLNARNPEGAGLSAPQLGILKRVIVARKFTENPNNPNETLSQEYVLINPKIISLSEEKEIDWEGCLSIPDTYGKVERAKKIKVKALNESGEEIRISASGFFARVILHEIDHLDGILFTSKTKGEILNETELDKLFEYGLIAA